MDSKKLDRFYEELHFKSVAEIESGNYFIDEQIDSKTDKRFGLTLLVRPDGIVKSNVERFLEDVRKIEPNQYYYPKDDLHVTVLSIVSCYDGFDLSNISADAYFDVVRKSLFGIDEFEIQFKGIALSNSGVLLKGFPTDDSLNKLRENLRKNFSQTNLEQSIDSRYPIVAAHITVQRFRETLQDHEKFLVFLEQFKDFDFGTSKIENLEFVFNDWYQRAENVKILHRFGL